MSPASWRTPRSSDDDPVLSPHESRWAPLVILGLLLGGLAVSALPRCTPQPTPAAAPTGITPMPDTAPRTVRVPRDAETTGGPPMAAEERTKP